jgi:prepilin-type N-terminal cleavage/methylation domain-containing protein
MKKRAFTLVEMVVSLVIIAVISAIVLVSFSLVDRRKSETVARNLVADLYLARQMAVSRHKDCIATFNYTAAAITDACGNNLNSENYSITDADCELLIPVRRVAPVDITNTCPNTLTFQSPVGMIELNPSSADTIRLEYAGRHKEIEVCSETGYVSLP